jgi:purine-cytosine permease-like protein
MRTNFKRIGYGEVCPGKLEPISRVFLLLYTFVCLGFFTTTMSLTSSWKHLVPGGKLALASVTLGLGMTLFTALEGLSQLEAAYASIITGTFFACPDSTRFSH